MCAWSHDSVSIDSSDPELTSLTSPSQKDQDFLPVSGAAGAIYDFAKDWQLALNLTYSQRAPTAEELFARGPHDATFQFIIGDPNLDVEINRSVDLSLRRTAGRVTGFLSGFYTSYDGFIDFTPTGEIEDGLQVFIYTPKNATFYGGEGRVDFHLLPLSLTKISEPSDSKSVKNVITGGEQIVEKNPNDLFLRLQADYVHAEDSSGEPLPRITPFRWGVSLNYDSEHWTASIEGWLVDSQNRVAQFETTTPNYTFFNVSAGYKFQAWTHIQLSLCARHKLIGCRRARSSFVLERSVPAARPRRGRRVAEYVRELTFLRWAAETSLEVVRRKNQLRLRIASLSSSVRSAFHAILAYFNRLRSVS